MMSILVRIVLFIALLVVALLIVIICSVEMKAQTLEGKARVQDGDTIRIGQTHWRLDGINAPELFEPYGQASRVEMEHIIDTDKVTCKWNGEMSYRRYVGICMTVHYPDIGAELIRRGLALDCTRYSRGRYRALEPPGARSRLAGKRYCD
jgi:micrococcal nuclease